MRMTASMLLSGASVALAACWYDVPGVVATDGGRPEGLVPRDAASTDGAFTPDTSIGDTSIVDGSSPCALTMCSGQCVDLTTSGATAAGAVTTAWGARAQRAPVSRWCWPRAKAPRHTSPWTRPTSTGLAAAA